MDLNYSQEELAFRDQVRGWLKANLPADLREKIANYEELTRDDLLRWHRILAAKGWVAPAWPKEWGGTGWNVVQRYIFEEELGYAGAPPLIPFGLAMCAAVLLRFQQGLSYPEIARLSNEKAPALQVRVARALPVLRRCLEEKGMAP